eukprot:TRINITY_DN47385_c0_g1_i1.p2 TRINITY_DN47385_c0_g1~~TRINITY_DN47385_c0_g1_i1.p2  ORF type:complete len:118 (+),score=30.31 TRINITY_DN47385_c0_g1_i1:54-356(+)
MLRSLVGSEMCIRDRSQHELPRLKSVTSPAPRSSCRILLPQPPAVVMSHCSADPVMQSRAALTAGVPSALSADNTTCLLYTSDAADEEDSVDLGGRRVVK